MTTSTRQYYRLKRQFISGLLCGTVHEEITAVQFPVGFICEKPCKGDPYVVLECTPVIDLPHRAGQTDAAGGSN